MCTATIVSMPQSLSANTILDVTLADLLSRYPDLIGLMLGSGLSLFADKQERATSGVLLQVKEALEIRGICPDLFQMLLEKTIMGQNPEVPVWIVEQACERGIVPTQELIQRVKIQQEKGRRLPKALTVRVGGPVPGAGWVDLPLHYW